MVRVRTVNPWKQVRYLPDSIDKWAYSITAITEALQAPDWSSILHRSTKIQQRMAIQSRLRGSRDSCVAGPL